MMEWKTIDSAPKDGTNILLYSESLAVEGYWSAERKRFSEVGYSFVGCGCCADVLEPPTHWMPLPKAPE